MPQLEDTQSDMPDSANEFSEPQFIKAIRAQIAPPYIKITPTLLMWVFTIASIIGLGFEDVFHVLMYGEWESRAGLVWGPFSSIYGVGAVLLILFLNRFYYTHNLIIFLIAMVLGASLEYGASFMMETFFHAIAWDYTGTFGSIGGRTNFVFGMVWGMLGLFWVRMIMPIIKQLARRVNAKSISFRVISACLIVFMTLNIVMTVLALNREGERANDIPADSLIDEMLDEWFPDWWMQERFENMTVAANLDSEKGNTPTPDNGIMPLMPSTNIESNTSSEPESSS